MDLGLERKVAIVTGASQGLGFACAAALAAEGAAVAICSRFKERIEAAAGRIKAATGRRPLALVADLTSAPAIRGLVAAVARDLGPPVILVNNTGGPPPGGIDEIDDAAWEASFRLTVLSAIRMIREVLPHMKAGRFGRIVNLQSRSVKEPVDGLLTSNTIRPGVIGLAKTLSLELGGFGITVNSVLPGFIRTERLKELAEDRARRQGCSAEDVFRAWSAGNPVGRIGEPEEVASLVAFLASSRAAFINGTAILVDGGGVRSIT